ncbi:MAG TPA: Re/Si-specific NAD(P)(+) transhydrogenase subunit alpha [Cytophagales bacterium]|nr:Re/Si-specific NAD(P)(+) transhydrogenase subunit alpha [Cytophagales bacterium]
MLIGVVKEVRSGENRVALTPDVVKQLKKAGFDVVMESGAGMASGFSDISYQESGATIDNKNGILTSTDVLLKVNTPIHEEVNGLKEGAVIISFLYAYTQPSLIDALVARKISAFAMDAVPRISRAQKMDALSSQSNLAGYKAVLLGANALKKIFPLMMTAAGTITPAKVLIFGAGVAGLQAIATAKRLGAVVEVTDVRPETKEQVESLGGRFIEVKTDEQVKTAGGYAREVSTEYLQKQQELVKKHVADADIVITTALVMGKKAPILVTEEMIKSMKPGSVVVDMAVESGGNCALSKQNETVIAHEVTIIGEGNLPSLLSVNASELYARNISTLLFHLATKDGLKWEMEEEITKGSLITHKGELVHSLTIELIK